MPSFFNNGDGSSRFQLPALNLNFGSITDGTNIPPPPDSPVQKVPTPPQTPPPVQEVPKEVKQDTDKDTQSSLNATSTEASQESKPVPSNGKFAGTKRYADEDAPLSPAASSRQGSIRRLFSRNMLNNSYAEGQMSSSNGNLPSTTSYSTPTNNIRPSSQSGASYLDDRKARRNSGWFRRMRSNDTASKRSSTMMLDETPRVSTPKRTLGPPPPMIPELSDIEKDNGSLGVDLFKNIK